MQRKEVQSMPICIQASLPAVDVLQSENIFVMPAERAAIQDILLPRRLRLQRNLL